MKNEECRPTLPMPPLSITAFLLLVSRLEKRGEEAFEVFRGILRYYEVFEVC